MLSLNISTIIKARGIERPYTFLVNAGFTPNIATTILSNQKKAVRLDHIEKICIVLNCTPNDILQWSPDKNKILSKNHPLTELKAKQMNVNWKETMRTLPLEQLNEVISLINKTTEPQKD